MWFVMFEKIKKFKILVLLLIFAAAPAFAVNEAEPSAKEDVIELNVEKTDLKDALSERKETEKN